MKVNYLLVIAIFGIILLSSIESKRHKKSHRRETEEERKARIAKRDREYLDSLAKKGAEKKNAFATNDILRDSKSAQNPFVDKSKHHDDFKSGPSAFGSLGNSYNISTGRSNISALSTGEYKDPTLQLNDSGYQLKTKVDAPKDRYDNFDSKDTYDAKHRSLKEGVHSNRVDGDFGAYNRVGDPDLNFNQDGQFFKNSIRNIKERENNRRFRKMNRKNRRHN